MKKTDRFSGFLENFLKKNREMKLSLLLFVLVLFNLNASTYSQNKKISLNVEKQSIENVLAKIESKSQFKFFYITGDVDVSQKVSIKVHKTPIKEILNIIFSNSNISYRLVKNQIVLKKKKYVRTQIKRAASIDDILKEQDYVVEGVITSEDGNPLPGANIVEKGTANGTQSDFDGNYSLKVSDKNAVLVISYIGFTTKELLVDGKNTINVTLKEDAASLEEVVIVAYSTQKKTTVTGAISSLKAKEVAEIPVSNVASSLAGRVTGLNMRPNGGAPGDDSPNINIRGVVTNGSSSPLIVVDGIRRNNLQQINPNSIETVTVLKDAAAVAPFGIGGANGVILITTKKGKLGKPSVSISTSVGFQKPTYLPEMVSAKDYMIIQNEGYFNDNPNGTTPPNDPNLVANYDNLHAQDPFLYPDSEFTDVYNTTSPVTTNGIDISGGTEFVTYRGALSRFKQEGIFDPVGYQRYNYDLALETKITPTTKVSLSLIGSIEDTKGIDANENLPHLFRSFYKFVPTQSLLYPGGDKWGESSASTPVGVLKSKGYRKDEDNTLLSSIAVEQDLSFIKGLSVKGVFSYDSKSEYEKGFHVPFVYQNIDLNTTPYTFTDAISNQEGNGAPFTWLQIQNRRSKTFTYQGYINYKRSFGNHNISGLFVAESTEREGDWFQARRERFGLDIDELDLGSSDLLDSSNRGSSWTQSELGYVYRLGYTYKDKYLLEASGRYDGHYSFAPGSRWGYFPAYSAGWRISEEKFMENISSIDNLKLRGSWGKSGNLPYFRNNNGTFRIADYQYLDGYDLRGNAYAFGSGAVVQGSRIPRESNPNITWEIATKLDVGFDLSMWNSLLKLEFDYFKEDRTGMLLPPQVTLPVEYGLDLAQENKGEMNNRGFEIAVSSFKKFDNGLIMNIGANFSYAKNEVVELFESDAQRENANRTRKGRPLRTRFGYKSLGLFSTSDDVNGDGFINADDGYNIQQFGDLRPGDIRYADLSGPDGVPDGIIDINDETVIGDPSEYPGMTFGLNTSFEYKGFDFSMFFQGAAKSSVSMRTFLTVPFSNNGSNFAYEYFDNRWTPDNQNARYPRATTAPTPNNGQNSDFWIEDTSYLRLKTLTLGYTLPTSLTDKIGVGPVRFHLIGQNLLTFSGLDFVDPELGYRDLERAYPVGKSFAFGVNISL